jgi:hypothetical protein
VYRHGRLFAHGWHVLLLLAVTWGCGRDGPPRRIVVGNVTYQGQPVADGQIRFTPMKGSKGPVSMTKIVDGQYSVDHQGGVPVATQRVEILAYQADPKYKGREKDVPPMFSPSEWPPKLQYLPPKYNTNSVLEVVIDSGRGELRKDFALAK